MDLKTTGLTMTTLVSLVVAGIVVTSTPNIYYCASRDLVFQCDRLSSTGKTCYIGNTSKVCTTTWEKLDLKQYSAIETDGIKTNTVVKDGRDWSCTGLHPTDMCYFGSRKPVTRAQLEVQI